MATRNVFLVRHGQYQTSLRDAGRLTDIGMAQARATTRMLTMFPFSRLYHSPVLRAVQTARTIVQGFGDLPLESSELLRECIPSIPAGMEYAMRTADPEINAEKASDCARKLDDAYDLFLARVDGGDDVFEMLVCHGNVIRYMVSRVMSGSPHGWMKMLINHCGVTRLLVDDKGVVYLVSHNETGHLSVDLYTHH